MYIEKQLVEQVKIFSNRGRNGWRLVARMSWDESYSGESTGNTITTEFNRILLTS